MGASPSPRPRVSSATPVPKCLWSHSCLLFGFWESHKWDSSIQVNAGGLLFYCWAIYSRWSGTAQSIMAFTLCTRAHVYFWIRHITPEAACPSQVPHSRSTSFLPLCLALTSNHKPWCKVPRAVSAVPTHHGLRQTRGRGSWPSTQC